MSTENLQPDLWGGAGIVVAEPTPAPKLKIPPTNLMRARYGACAVAGRTCGECVHFMHHQPGQNSYYKCRLRGVTNGPGTDHRVRWPACGMFLAITEAYTPNATGHTLAADWHKGLHAPAYRTAQNSVVCPYCAQLLGFKRGYTTYGIQTRPAYDAEIRRCPQRP